MAYDRWHTEGGEYFINISGPKLLRLGSEGILKIFLQRMIELVN